LADGALEAQVVIAREQGVEELLVLFSLSCVAQPKWLQGLQCVRDRRFIDIDRLDLW
jgi:hypothetical protein